MRHLILFATLVGVATSVSAKDWLTLPGDFSHDPVTGGRVIQYAPIQLPAAPQDPSFKSSGYTHFRSTIQYGQSADNYHRVETWGDPVRPYGEWRFPFRPYSTPYPNWGPPFGGLNVGLPAFGYPGVGIPPGYPPGHPSTPNPGMPNPGTPNPGTPNPGTPNPGGPGSVVPHPGVSNPGYGYGPGYGPGYGYGSGYGYGYGPGNPPGPVFDQPGNPYPAGGNSPYPVAPYYDGYYPTIRD